MNICLAALFFDRHHILQLISCISQKGFSFYQFSRTGFIIKTRNIDGGLFSGSYPSSGTVHVYRSSPFSAVSILLELEYFEQGKDEGRRVNNNFCIIINKKKKISIFVFNNN